VRTSELPRRKGRGVQLAALGRRVQLLLRRASNDTRSVCRAPCQGRGDVSSRNFRTNGNGFREGGVMPRQETRVCSVLICETMKFLQTLIIVTLLSLAALGQSPAQKIYDTERAFEKMVAEKGIRDGFIEFLSPLGVIFRPGPVNARESWRSRPASPA